MINAISAITPVRPIDPYPQNILTEGFVYLTELPINPLTKIVPETLEEQTRQVMKNIEASLAASGLGLHHVKKVSITLVNPSNYKLVKRIYDHYFLGFHPECNFHATSMLREHSQIEVEVVAVKTNDPM